MFCHYCGGANPDDARYCRTCGREIVWQAKASKAPTETAVKLGEMTGEQPGETPCPLCGKGIGTTKKQKELYGIRVCAACVQGFANRRHFAFLIDYSLMVLAVVSAASISGDPGSASTLSTVVFLACCILFLLRDGFNGHSPGKALLGLRVIDVSSGKPARALASLRRNLPLTIPILWLPMAFQLVKGPRLGDEYARTRVIWKKYSDKAPFSRLGPDNGARAQPRWTLTRILVCFLGAFFGLVMLMHGVNGVSSGQWARGALGLLLGALLLLGAWAVAKGRG